MEYLMVHWGVWCRYGILCLQATINNSFRKNQAKFNGHFMVRLYRSHFLNGCKNVYHFEMLPNVFVSI